MAKVKALATCTSCGDQMNKNGRCKHCQRGLVDSGGIAIFCSWCKKEIELGEGFELAKDDSFCHVTCVGEKNAIGQYMEEMNSSGGILLDMLADVEKPKHSAEEVPVAVKAIILQMEKTDWKLESMIFNVSADKE